MNALKFLFAALLFFAQPVIAQTFTGNSMGIVSTDNRIFPGTVLLGGTVTAGNQVTTTVTVGANNYPFTITAVSGDTLQTLVNKFIDALNNSGPMQSYGITGLQGNPAIMAFSVTPQRNGTPIPTIAVSVSGSTTATITSQAADLLDAAPIVYINRGNAAAAPKAGDTFGPLMFGGADASSQANWGCCTVQYASMMGAIGNPESPGSLVNLQGQLHFYTAGYLPAFGNLLNRMSLERGLVLYNASSVQAAGGDKGAGSINLPASGGLFTDGVRVHSRVTIAGNSINAIPAGTTSYVGLSGASTNSFSGLIGQSVPGTLKTLSVSADAAPGNGESYTATILINGSASALACTISNTASYCLSPVSITLTAPSSATLRVVTSAGAQPPRILWSMELNADIQ